MGWPTTKAIYNLVPLLLSVTSRVCWHPWGMGWILTGWQPHSPKKNPTTMCGTWDRDTGRVSNVSKNDWNLSFQPWNLTHADFVDFDIFAGFRWWSSPSCFCLKFWNRQFLFPERRGTPIPLTMVTRCHFSTLQGSYPLVNYITVCYWTWLFIVDLPIKNGDFPWFC